MVARGALWWSRLHRGPVRRPGVIPGVADQVESAFASAVERMEALDEQGELWRADLAQLRQIYPELTSFATWLKRGGSERIADKFLDATIWLRNLKGCATIELQLRRAVL